MQFLYQGSVGATTYWVASGAPRDIAMGVVAVRDDTIRSKDFSGTLAEFSSRVGSKLHFQSLTPDDEKDAKQEALEPRPKRKTPLTLAEGAQRARDSRLRRSTNRRDLQKEWEIEVKAGYVVPRARGNSAGEGFDFEGSYTFHKGAFVGMGASPVDQPEDWKAEIAQGRGQGWNPRNQLRFER
jgi:hypothetical protein